MSKHAVENTSGEGCANEPARVTIWVPDEATVLEAAARRAYEAYSAISADNEYATWEPWENAGPRVQAEWLAVARAVLSGG